MLNERIKVPVAVKKRQAALNAVRGDYRVNGLAHRYPERSQHTKVLRGLNGHGLPRQVHDHQRSHELLGLVEVTVADKTLKHFGQNQVAVGRLKSLVPRAYTNRYGRCVMLPTVQALESHMPTHIYDLEAEILSLDATDRAHLLERLIESFEPSSKVQDAWVSEALRREADVQAGKVSLVPGQEAVARVRARLA